MLFNFFSIRSLLHFDDFLVSNQAEILNRISVVILAEIVPNISMTLFLTILCFLNRMYESVCVSWQTYSFTCSVFLSWGCHVGLIQH